MNIEILLKKHFPKFKIYNATNKTEKEIEKIIDICMNVNNLIVYIIWNNDNDIVFEKYKHHNIDNPHILFFNTDNYYMFGSKDIENLEGSIRFLKRFIENDHICCICHQTLKEYDMFACCQICGVAYCCECTNKMKLNKKELLCSVCRSYDLMCLV